MDRAHVVHRRAEGGAAGGAAGCEIDYGSAPTGDGWREHPRYEQLREEFDYDHPRNGGY